MLRNMVDQETAFRNSMTKMIIQIQMRKILNLTSKPRFCLFMVPDKSFF